MKNTVFCSECNEWYYAEDIEFLNIEEDISGRDLVTFVCKRCGEETISLVRGW